MDFSQCKIESVQKSSPEKRAIKISKIGIGPWFEHPGTFHIYI